MQRHIQIGLTLGIAIWAGGAALADIIIASEDHAVRRGPIVEDGLHAKQSSNNATDRYLMLRFNSPDFGSGVTAATFQLTANADTDVQFQGTFDYRVYGIPETSPVDELFTEGAANYTPGSGNVYDGSGDLVDDSVLVNLGDVLGVSAGDTINFSTPALLSFIQSDTNDAVSLAFVRLTNSGDNSTFLDQNTGSPPRLDITVAVPEPRTATLLGLAGLLVIRRLRLRRK